MVRTDGAGAVVSVEAAVVRVGAAPGAMNDLVKVNERFQLLQLKNVIPQLGVLAPSPGGFGAIAEAVSPLLALQANLAKSNELFQLLQPKYILRQLLREMKSLARARWLLQLLRATLFNNAAQLNELFEHEVAALSFKELMPGFMESAV